MAPPPFYPRELPGKSIVFVVLRCLSEELNARPYALPSFLNLAEMVCLVPLWLMRPTGEGANFKSAHF